MVEGGFKRARVHNNFKSEDLTLERKVVTFLVVFGVQFFLSKVLNYRPIVSVIKQLEKK